MAKDPAWKRVVGGVCGIAILIVVLLLLRDRGVSGEHLGRWQGAIVFGAAGAAGALWIAKRRRR